jgi:hypothetical protein
MAPKKKADEPKERPILGRFKSNLKVSRGAPFGARRGREAGAGASERTRGRGGAAERRRARRGRAQRPLARRAAAPPRRRRGGARPPEAVEDAVARCSAPGARPRAPHARPFAPTPYPLRARPPRPGHQMGIVGMPNVGKSTLFNTLSKMGIPAENFPFCTSELGRRRRSGGAAAAGPGPGRCRFVHPALNGLFCSG